MILRRTPTETTLVDVHDLKCLHVDVVGDSRELDDWGTLDPDGEHLWIEIATLRNRGRLEGVSGDWEHRFDEMIAYANTNGWVSDDRVRAHIVFTS